MNQSLSKTLFKTLFERLSYVDFEGEPNPQRMVLRAYPSTRVVRGGENAGMLLGLLYDMSEDTPQPVTFQHHTVNHRTRTEPVMYYACVEDTTGPKPQRWSLQAAILDKPVSECFINRLRHSQIAYDPTLHEEQAAARLNELRSRERVLASQQREIQEQIDGNLRAMTLPGLTTDEMNFFLNRKRSLTDDLAHTAQRLEALRAQQRDAQEMSRVFKTLDELLLNWSHLSARQQRRYLSRFIEMVGIRVGTTGFCELWIYWRNTFDATLDAAEIETFRIRLTRARPTEWSDERNALMMECYLLPQVEIMKRLPECTWGAICRQMNRLGLDRRGELTRLGRRPEYKAICDNVSWNDWCIEHPDETEPLLPPRRKKPKKRWTTEEETTLQGNLHLPRIDLMQLLPDRSWGSIVNHIEALDLPRAATLAAHGVSPNAGFGKGCPIPVWMSYAEWQETQSRQEEQPQENSGSTPFDLNALVDNLLT
jgi:hypothetical protein